MSMMTKEFQMMNTNFECFGLPFKKENDLIDWMKYVEKHFSRFEKNSELSILNTSVQDCLKVSELMYELLILCDAFYIETEGLFNPFLGDVIKKLGYDRSFEIIKKQNTSRFQTLLPGLAAVRRKESDNCESPKRTDMIFEGYNNKSPVSFCGETRCVRLTGGAKLDLGGIAKGWSAQKIYEKFENDGIKYGLINAGGDIILWGIPPEENWGVGIQNPFGEKDAGSLWFDKTTGIATSSRLKRRWRNSGKSDVHHIIDPRTNESCHSDIVQATVISNDLVSSEVYAKCLLILGSMKGIDFLNRKRPDMACVIIKEDRSIIYNDQLKKICKESEVGNKCSK